MTETPPLPRLAIRIGVTGSLSLPTDRQAALRAEVVRALGIIKTAVELVGRDTEAQDLYDISQPPQLTFISSLAEGADRLAGHAALETGFTLRAILPFNREEYAKDFNKDGSVTEYEALLSHADGGIVELDGGRDDYEVDSYEAAGHLMVRTSDLVIAIWDRSPGQRAGAEWVMRYAQRQGVPIWWIHTDGSQPSTLVHGHTRMSSKAAVDGQEAVMTEYLRRLLVPPKPTHQHPSALLDWFGRFSQSLAPEPARVYLTSRRRPDRSYWHVYAWWLGGAAPPPSTGSVDNNYWIGPMVPADLRANDYGQRVRSGYFWVSVLTLLSVLLAVTTLFFHEPLLTFPFIVAEICALCLVSAVLLSRHWHDWPRRWQDYRRLTEALRSRQLLTPFMDETAGWSRRAIHTTIRSTRGAASMGAGSLWVEWMVSAYARAAPTGSIHFDETANESARATAIAFLRNQKAYHEFSSERAHRADAMVRWFDELLLPIIILLIVAKAVLVLIRPDFWAIGLFGFTAAVLPVLALNVVSIRAAWHLHLNSVRSQAMADAMDVAIVRLEAVNVTLPLASQDLSAIATEVADSMAQDTDIRFELSEAG